MRETPQSIEAFIHINCMLLTRLEVVLYTLLLTSKLFQPILEKDLLLRILSFFSRRYFFLLRHFSQNVDHLTQQVIFQKMFEHLLGYFRRFWYIPKRRKVKSRKTRKRNILEQCGLLIVQDQDGNRFLIT